MFSGYGISPLRRTVSRDGGIGLIVLNTVGVTLINDALNAVIEDDRSLSILFSDATQRQPPEQIVWRKLLHATSKE
jgi:hypothetical protein